MRIYSIDDLYQKIAKKCQAVAWLVGALPMALLLKL